MHKINKTIKFKAFSLIEMLLVISIISILMLLGAVFAYKYAEQVKVERTATQITQLSEAGVKYYLVYNQWPEYPVAPNFQAYLSFADLKNPWGQLYTYVGDGMKFTVVTSLPNDKLVTRVVNLLTDAYVDDTDPNKIKAETLVAPNYRAMPRMFVNDVGHFEILGKDLSANNGSLYGYTINDVKACPPEYKQTVITTINNIEFGTLVYNKYMPQLYSSGTTIADCSSGACKVDVQFSGNFCYTQDSELGLCDSRSTTRRVSMAGPICSNSSVCNDSSGDKIVDGDGKIGFYYISYCEKK